MFAFYQLLIIACALPAAVFFALRCLREGTWSGWRHFSERCGRWPQAAFVSDGRPVLWFHCASLGEVRAAEPLVGLVSHEYRIVISTLTAAGRDRARLSFPGYAVQYAPLDLLALTARVMRRLHPQALIIVETELWPGLVRSARQMRIPVVVVNGRISARSLRWYIRTRALWRSVLSGCAAICVRSQEDARRYIALGAPAGVVSVTGNMKYDHDHSGPREEREALGFSGDDLIFTAGSTRDGEEALLAPVIADLANRCPHFKAVLAPRHVHRALSVVQELERCGLRVHLSSRPAGTPFNCLVVDRLGLLMRYYSVSDLAFAGGSLVPLGGQNPLEPAGLGIPVLFGPSMENFSAESRLLLDGRGALMVNDAAGLSAAIGRLIADPAERAAMGEHARACVMTQRGAAERTAERVRAAAGSR